MSCASELNGRAGPGVEQDVRAEAIEPWVKELLNHLAPGAAAKIASDPVHAVLLGQLASQSFDSWRLALA